MPSQAEDYLATWLGGITTIHFNGVAQILRRSVVTFLHIYFPEVIFG